MEPLVVSYKRCHECRLGGHENYSEDVRMYSVKDPDGNEKTKREYLCSEHLQAKLEDGYEIKEVRVGKRS